MRGWYFYIVLAADKGEIDDSFVRVTGLHTFDFSQIHTGRLILKFFDNFVEPVGHFIFLIVRFPALDYFLVNFCRFRSYYFKVELPVDVLFALH